MNIKVIGMLLRDMDHGYRFVKSKDHKIWVFDQFDKPVVKDAPDLIGAIEKIAELDRLIEAELQIVRQYLRKMES